MLPAHQEFKCASLRQLEAQVHAAQVRPSTQGPNPGAGLRRVLKATANRFKAVASVVKVANKFK